MSVCVYFFFATLRVCVHSSVERLCSHNATFLTFHDNLFYFISWKIFKKCVFLMHNESISFNHIHTPACVYCCRKIFQSFFCFFCSLFSQLIFFFSFHFGQMSVIFPFTLLAFLFYVQRTFRRRKKKHRENLYLCPSLCFCFFCFSKRKVLYLSSENVEEIEIFATQKLNEKQSEPKTENSFNVSTSNRENYLPFDTENFSTYN